MYLIEINEQDALKLGASVPSFLKEIPNFQELKIYLKAENNGTIFMETSGSYGISVMDEETLSLGIANGEYLYVQMRDDRIGVALCQCEKCEKLFDITSEMRTEWNNQTLYGKMNIICPNCKHKNLVEINLLGKERE